MEKLEKHWILSIGMLSCVRLFGTLWTVACQAPLSMGFSRQEYWSELPFPSPGDLANPGIEPTSLASPALAGRFFTTASPGKPYLSLLRSNFSHLSCTTSTCNSNSQRDLGFIPSSEAQS